jgi:hypothetical protein
LVLEDAVAELLRLVFLLDFEDVAEDVAAGLAGVRGVRHHRVHAEEGLVGLVDLVAVSGGGNQIGDFGVGFGEVGGEVHFFPSELLLGFDPWKSELRAQAVSLDEVESAICISREVLAGRS